MNIGQEFCYLEDELVNEKTCFGIKAIILAACFCSLFLMILLLVESFKLTPYI